MQLEFHQLDRRWEHLRVRQPHRQRRLMASLAESGQQTPIVVVLSPDQRDRYLVIDGHKRIAALQQLGRDTVEATVWAMSDRCDGTLTTVQRGTVAVTDLVRHVTHLIHQGHSYLAKATRTPTHKRHK